MADEYEIPNHYMMAIPRKTSLAVPLINRVMDYVIPIGWTLSALLYLFIDPWWGGVAAGGFFAMLHLIASPIVFAISCCLVLNIFACLHILGLF